MIPQSAGPRLALVALALGAVALFSEPHRGPFVRLDASELGMIVQQETDHVTPTELAAWIVEGRSDYRLLDLRSAEEFASYHIPGAENVQASQLSGYPLLPTEKIVLYSGGGIHAAQGWMLLRALGFKAVYALLGGLDGWTDEVLYPAPPAGDDARAKAGFERAAAMATFFGGQPRVAAGETPSAQPVLPRLAAPVAGPTIPVAPRGKKREGC
jgi:rhodanese-related sulfurtransferase